MRRARLLPRFSPPRRPAPDSLTPWLGAAARGIGAVAAWCWARLLDLLWVAAAVAVVYVALVALAALGAPWAAPVVRAVRVALVVVRRLV